MAPGVAARTPAWQPVTSDGDVAATPTRIVDFGHDFARDQESYPVGLYHLHRWRLTEANGVYSAEAPVVLDRTVDVDGDGQTGDDCIAAMPLSLAEPLSPVAPWYDREAASSRFYGGLVFTHANQPEGAPTEIGINMEHDGPPHHPRDNWTLFYEIFDLHASYRAHALYLWVKKDFELGGDTHRVSFDEHSELSLLLQRYYMGFEGCRWVVRNGERYYVSEVVFRGAGTRPGNGLGRLHTVRPAVIKWASFNPQPPYDIAFDPDTAEYAFITFDDVQAVGWYLFKDEWQAAYTGFKWYAFEATALVHRPGRPSEFIAMNHVATAPVPPFYGSVTEVPYRLWKQIFRRARSNAFAAGPRGYSFDSDGDMGSMDLLMGTHSLDEPVTDISVYDIAAWCNALSAFEMRDPVYYEDAEFTRPFERVVLSPLFRQPRPLPPLHVKWSADGYRLPTPSEFEAMRGDVSSPPERQRPGTYDVSDAEANPLGFRGLHDNASEILWSFGDSLNPSTNSATVVAADLNELLPICRPVNSLNRHPLAGFRLVRRDAGLPPPPAAQLGTAELPAPAPPMARQQLGVAVVSMKGGNAVGKFELSFREWRMVYDWAVSNGYEFDSDGDMGSMDYWGFEGRPLADSHGPDEPVTDITLYDAMVWCNALSEMTGRTPLYHATAELDAPLRKAHRYRPLFMTLGEAAEANAGGLINLRSELAMQHPHVDSAANGYRLPTTTEYQEMLKPDGQYPWARTPTVVLEHAWIFDNSPAGTRPVGTRKPTANGVHDIAGNVSELVDPDARSGWSAKYNAGRSGGSFLDLVSSVPLMPRLQPRGIGYPDLGFRVVLQQGAPSAPASLAAAQLDMPDTPSEKEANADEKNAASAPLLQGQTFRGNQRRTGVLKATGVARNPVVAWRYTVGGSLRSSPVVVDDVVYLGSHAGKFYALRLHDGSVLWEIETSGPVSGSALVVDGAVYFVSEGGVIYAINASAGTVLWQTKATNQRPCGTPALFGDLLIFGSGTRHGSDRVGMTTGPIIAVDRRTGTVAWSGPAGAQGFDAPAVDRGVMYCGMAADTTGAIDLVTRKPLWQYNPGNQDRQWVSPVLLDNGVIVIGSITGSVSLVDRTTGKRIWRQYLLQDQVAINNEGSPGHEILAAPALHDGLVLVPGNDGALHAFSAADGTRLWRYAATGPVRSAPTLANGVAYFGDDAGTLHAVNPDTGHGIWGLNLGAAIRSSPWPIDGMIVVGTDAGEVIAVRTGGPQD